MERSEPSLIPQWLKGAAGSGVASSHVYQSGIFQDDGGSQFLPRHKVLQQLPAYDSPRGSTLSDRARRGFSSGSSTSSVSDREFYAALTRSSSIRSHGSLEIDRDGLKGDVQSDRDWDWEGDRDLWLREKDRSLFGTDERERERENLENGMLRPTTAGTSGKQEAETMLRRSLSMGISHRIPDRKMNDVNPPAAMPSASGGLATSMQKAAFERNFPSLGADEKQGGPPRSPGSSSVASPRSLWQGSSRTDLGRASSPGLTASAFGGSISITSSSASGGADLWSSALAEAPSANGNIQSNGANVLAVRIASLLSSASPGTGCGGSSNALNMAEALTQNPPRVRTPPQVFIESQRLEELALKQSRQLIPMSPSLPKTMSLTDKAKSKSSRTLDGMVTSSFKGNQPLGSLQLNSPHRSLAPARSDNLKLSQGKLLVLKSSKDSNMSASGVTRSEGSNSPQVAAYGNTGLTASTMTAAGVSIPSTGVLGQQRRQSLDRRSPLLPGAAGVDALSGLRAKDLANVGEDKRSSLQAQKRSDFFNALRKKAADNGSVSVSYNKSDSSHQQKSDLMNLSKAVMPDESAMSLGHGSEAKGNSVGQGPHSIHFLSEAHRNGEVKHSPGNGLILDETGGLVKEPSAVGSLEGDIGVPLPGDSEEEEAAFMRSLGWEENAEDSELTEEEINAFYQMRERKNLLNSRSHCRFRNFSIEHRVGSSRSPSSCQLSSDSESDDELRV